MKRFLFFSTIAFSGLFISCTNNNKNKADSSSSTSQKEENYKSAISKVYKAIETGDMNSIDSLLADGFIDHNPPGGKELRNKDSVKAQLLQMHNQIKNLKFEVIANAYDNDYIFSLRRITGTTLVPMNGLPANSVIDEYGIDVARLRDGKQVEHWSFVDPNVMIKRMNMPESAKSN